MEDLSAKLGLNWATGLTAGESESAGNTITHDDKNIAMKAPGSSPVNALPEWTDEPALEVPPVKGPTHLTGAGKKSDGSWATSPMTTGFTKAGE